MLDDYYNKHDFNFSFIHDWIIGSFLKKIILIKCKFSKINRNNLYLGNLFGFNQYHQPLLQKERLINFYDHNFFGLYFGKFNNPACSFSHIL